jgi:heme-degrading monooxygenase HmoA
MILRDEEDPSRYVVVRRWDDVTAIQRWTDTRPDDLAAAVLATIEEGSSDSQVLTKVADLG